MSVTGVLQAAAEMQQNEAMKVAYLSARDYESRELWKSVALQLIQKTDQEDVILAANAVANAYINFVNTQENN